MARFVPIFDVGDSRDKYPMNAKHSVVETIYAVLRQRDQRMAGIINGAIAGGVSSRYFNCHMRRHDP